MLLVILATDSVGLSDSAACARPVTAHKTASAIAIVRFIEAPATGRSRTKIEHNFAAPSTAGKACPPFG
jgi:hypothetical protein